MATPNWRLKGCWIKNCNCDTGCPCDFMAHPTKGTCEGMLAMKIDSGYFENTDLSGLSFVARYHWPGALHEGGGTAQIILPLNSTEEQRAALLQILSGEAQEWGFFKMVSTILDKVLPPIYAPIELDFDLERRTARVFVPELLETVSEPIRNPVTGEEHRVQVALPEGIEYKNSEVACARINWSTGDIAYNWPNSHSSLAYVEHSPAGLINS